MYDYAAIILYSSTMQIFTNIDTALTYSNSSTFDRIQLKSAKPIEPGEVFLVINFGAAKEFLEEIDRLVENKASEEDIQAIVPQPFVSYYRCSDGVAICTKITKTGVAIWWEAVGDRLPCHPDLVSQ